MHRLVARGTALLAVLLLVLVTGACSSRTTVSAISGNTIVVGFNPAGENRQQACYEPSEDCQISLAEAERLGSDESVVIID